MTDAMNYLQSELKAPPVTEVLYDTWADRFYWQGPQTGKAMSMDQTRFTTEVWRPYYLVSLFCLD
jgi:hypothetical protein